MHWIDKRSKTIESVIKVTIAPGSLIYTDEYGIYNPVVKWGYEHKTVCHGRGEYARDEEAMGFLRCMSTLWER